MKISVQSIALDIKGKEITNKVRPLTPALDLVQALLLSIFIVYTLNIFSHTSPLHSTPDMCEYLQVPLCIFVFVCIFVQV